MKETQKNTDHLLSEIEELKSQLFEANSIIDSIKQGEIDALVVHKEGKAQVYSLESADYTYRILIEKFGEGALSIADNGMILYCNDYFSKLIGLKPTKIIGTFFEDYVAFPSKYYELKEAIKEGNSKGELTLKFEDKIVPVYVSLSDLHPMVSALGIVVTDLTEKKKQEKILTLNQKQLEQKVNELHLSNVNLEQFIHVISHDLKEPLRKILTYTSMLNENKSNLLSEKEVANMNVISSSANRLNSLVDDLVKYAFSAVKEDRANVDLNDVFKEVLEDLELIIKENNASIKFDNFPFIKGSKVQMRQLFSNLISNAIKYNKENQQPEIIIYCDQVDGESIQMPEKVYSKISFSDNGIGMNSDHLGKIFTIFQRLHMKNEYSGNGIGLAICKKIMDNHSGKIDVKSSPDGSIFELYLPLFPQ
ncbi:sensor histidine kinase [Flavobacterium macacae]|uniref:histidine kinase n=1 Tax=Flavobacterium macacae TaxID=2488993 RepID=A0A3P3WBM8_9FLAO|nr:ATP-binding protein [Flavobacterium macacae]RRJ92582.1 PAS domain S-box protein [Flavobacterium macacae]